MRTAIYGAGAMGTILGAYITKAGNQIDLINRNEKHVSGLKEMGARVVGTVEFTQKVSALLPSEMEGKYDIIFLMTKQLANKEIVTGLVPFLSDNGIICTMQNGMPEPSVASIVGEDKVAGCAMSWGATFVGDGIAELTTVPSRETLTFSVGRFGKVNEDVFQEIVRLLNVMGNVKVEENFIGARWVKLLVNSAFSGLSAVLDATFGEIANNKISRKIVQLIIKECIEVGKASNIKIEPIQGKDVAKLFDFQTPFKKWLSYQLIPIAMKKHQRLKSSMLQDLKKGKNCEIEAINGVVSLYGKKSNTPTPINDLILTIVHQIESGKYEPNWNNIDLFQAFLR